ncbi:hypothetical protein ABMY26_23495 [Azospirillum sp. HJ39]|uniref:hypothetical protein n=1 Tax=Azospirillum sp. HJ39 TaxID=3159496 RepID=UPI0035583C2B
MQNDAVVADLKKVAGVMDTKNITREEGRKIIDLAGQGRLRREHVKFLMENFPQFVELARESVQSFKAVAEAASKSQLSGIEAIKSSIDTQSKAIESLLGYMDSEETRNIVSGAIVDLAKCSGEMAKSLEKMNESNNDFWKDAMKIGAVSVIAVAAVFKIFR